MVSFTFISRSSKTWTTFLKKKLKCEPLKPGYLKYEPLKLRYLKHELLKFGPPKFQCPKLEVSKLELLKC
jgi:hypothetical protein